jgi:hypothetical protein
MGDVLSSLSTVGERDDADERFGAVRDQWRVLLSLSGKLAVRLASDHPVTLASESATRNLENLMILLDPTDGEEPSDTSLQGMVLARHGGDMERAILDACEDFDRARGGLLRRGPAGRRDQDRARRRGIRAADGVARVPPKAAPPPGKRLNAPRLGSGRMDDRRRADRVEATARALAAEVWNRFFHVRTLRDGRIVRLSIHTDRNRALEAAGLSEYRRSTALDESSSRGPWLLAVVLRTICPESRGQTLLGSAWPAKCSSTAGKYPVLRRDCQVWL